MPRNEVGAWRPEVATHGGESIAPTTHAIAAAVSSVSPACGVRRKTQEIMHVRCDVPWTTAPFNASCSKLRTMGGTSRWNTSLR